MRISDWSSDVCSSDLLECLQAIGSFKARGATNKLLTLDPAAVERGLVTASGGNHGLGVAYAAWPAKVPATSEERRVGKACVSTVRYWGVAYDLKKNKK